MQLRYKTRAGMITAPPEASSARPPARRRVCFCAGCGCCLCSWSSSLAGPRPAQVNARAPSRPLGAPSPTARDTGRLSGLGCRGTAAAMARANGVGASPSAHTNGQVRLRGWCVQGRAGLRGARGVLWTLGPASVTVSDEDASPTRRDARSRSCPFWSCVRLCSSDGRSPSRRGLVLSRCPPP